MGLDGSADVFITSDQLPDTGLLQVILRFTLSQALKVYQSNKHRVQPAQTVAVPPKKLIWNRYHLHRLRCHCCGGEILSFWLNAFHVFTWGDTSLEGFLSCPCSLGSVLRHSVIDFIWTDVLIRERGLIAVHNAKVVRHLRKIPRLTKITLYLRNTRSTTMRRVCRHNTICGQQGVWWGLWVSSRERTRRRSKTICTRNIFWFHVRNIIFIMCWLQSCCLCDRRIPVTSINLFTICLEWSMLTMTDSVSGATLCLADKCVRSSLRTKAIMFTWTSTFAHWLIQLFLIQDTGISSFASNSGLHRNQTSQNILQGPADQRKKALCGNGYRNVKKATHQIHSMCSTAWLGLTCGFVQRVTDSWRLMWYERSA